MSTGTPSRVVPVLDPDTEFFWTSGRDGRLRFLRCEECAQFIHPPAPDCPHCSDGTLRPTAVSGNGHVFSVTVNHHPWTADAEVPYAVAIVEIEEQHGLRLTTNIVGCEPDEVTIGMEVRVVFEDHRPIFLPLFTPRGRDTHAQV